MTTITTSTLICLCGVWFLAGAAFAWAVLHRRVVLRDRIMSVRAFTPFVHVRFGSRCTEQFLRLDKASLTVADAATPERLLHREIIITIQ